MVLNFAVLKQEKVKDRHWGENQVNAALEHINVTLVWGLLHNGLKIVYYLSNIVFDQIKCSDFCVKLSPACFIINALHKYILINSSMLGRCPQKKPIILLLWSNIL